ncbi:hypothetical protein V495_05169 [Pseudogymnoascus sp. VKM F-4514 (FW-929)]|nr:hypothetical protein V495_05169 [Pseudogymnoascus sp. VKM F-4514 (FW-929)]KFY58317.1 hypothetical protein V497_04904 [Pseudogymnoascus sp. VKM F-4516 (FW-969)]
MQKQAGLATQATIKELEFAIATTHPNNKDPHPTHPGRIYFSNPQRRLMPDSEQRARVHEAIYIALRAAGLPLELVPNCDYKTWFVTDDLTIYPPHRSAPCNDSTYRWHSADVISPALYFCPESLTQIQVACATISTQFRVAASRTTGLHVHVGDGAKGFSPNTLRNLIALLWGFEPQLQTLHPPHRHTETWCTPLRTDTNYADTHPDWTIQSLLEDLFSSKLETVGALVREFDVYCGDRCAVEFSNLNDPMVVIKQTIEFRAHAGTLDGDEVVMWVKTVVGIVQWARDADFSQLKSLMAFAETGNDGFGVTSLLEMLGLREQAEFYKNRLHPLKVAQEQLGREYETQDLAGPRTDVLEAFGIGGDGEATRDNWEKDLIFHPYS